MKIYNFDIIKENKKKFFKLFCRGILKNINNLKSVDMDTKLGIFSKLKKYV